MTRVHGSTAVRVGVVLVVGSLLLVGLGPAAAEDPLPFIAAWGSQGAGDGEFFQPNGVALGPDNGYVYVTDHYNNRVQVFERDGTFVATWGTPGTGPGQFNQPIGIAVDPDTGDVYVTENNRVQKFDADGNFLLQWGSYGSATGQFNGPMGVAVNGTTGRVYTAEEGSRRVQVFEPDGTFVATWGASGAADGQFNRPFGLGIDPVTGDVYVADTSNHRVQRFTADGTFLNAWGTYGAATGQFNEPMGVTVDPATRDVYVTDWNHRVQRFDADGAFVTTWGSFGTGDGQFHTPWGLSVDPSDGNLYVVDANNHRIQRFGGVSMRPDGRIKKGTGVFIGNDVYNTTGEGQTRTARVARGATITYTIKVQNDALVADTLRLKGTRASTHYRVTYTAGGLDITDEVTAGTYTTPVLSPGATHTVRAVVKVKATAPIGSSLTAALTAKSATTPAVKDTVKFVTRRA